MRANLDFIPVYCPNCGGRLYLTGWALNDFIAEHPVQCPCGTELVYTRSSGENITRRRREDMVKYWAREPEEPPTPSEGRA